MASKYCTDLAKICEDLHDRFHLINETDEPLRSQIKRFWQDIGLPFPGVATPWSAAFVSSCVKKAGATAAEFKFAAAHSVFVHKAIANAASNSGVFRGVDIATGKPEIGDIIQNNRGGSTFDFNFAAGHPNYQSHSAIVVETGADFGRTLRAHRRRQRIGFDPPHPRAAHRRRPDQAARGQSVHLRDQDPEVRRGGAVPIRKAVSAG